MARALEGGRSPARGRDGGAVGLRGQEEARHRCVGGWERGGAADGTPARQRRGASPQGQQADGAGACYR